MRIPPPRHAKTNATGRNDKGPRFIKITFPELSSKAYRSLSPVARCLYIELLMIHDGRNNGTFWLTQSDAAELIGCDVRTIAKAFAELRTAGFIVVTGTASTPGYRGRPTNTYRLTAWPVPGKQGPTHDWRDYESPGGALAKRIDPAMLLIKRREAAAQRQISMMQDAQYSPQLSASSAEKPATPDAHDAGLNASSDIETLAKPHVSRGPLKGTLPRQDIPPSASASPQVRGRLRSDIRALMVQGVRQSAIADAAGLSASKLSRFMSDDHNRRDLTDNQARALADAIKMLTPQKSARPSTGDTPCKAVA